MLEESLSESQEDLETGPLLGSANANTAVLNDNNNSSNIHNNNNSNSSSANPNAVSQPPRRNHVNSLKGTEKGINGNSISSVASDEDSVRLRVKLANESKDITINIGKTATVAELKGKISKLIKAEGRYLRLICSGRMIHPESQTIGSFKLVDDSFVHCVVTDHPVRNVAPQRVEEKEEDVAPGNRRGFDRLRDHGLSSDEVLALRSYFSGYLQTFIDQQPVRENESEQDRRLRLEDAWMERQGDGTEFAINTNSIGRRLYRDYNRAVVMEIDDGTRELDSRLEHMDRSQISSIGARKEFLWGFLMGFCLGFIMLFWLWERSMTHHQKMGILTGVSVHLGWNILRRQS